MEEYNSSYTGEEIDMRLGWAGSHASRHAVNGADPLTPEAIGAATSAALAEETAARKAITADSLGAAKKSTVTTETLFASSWSGSTYTLSVSGATANNIIELDKSPSITAEQLEALQAANIVGTAQTSGSITLKAFGDVPTIDIPIIVIVRGDL